ncbi:MAG: UvrD-helicase domain-containing protein [bacterium]
MLLKKLGKYEIIEWLGGGRFGDVFLARDTILDLNFALKVSRMRQEEIIMLKDEAKLLASLNHPNIVRFYNVDIIENKFVMVMEYVRGKTLRDIIKDGGIAINEILNIIYQVLDALNYAHKTGVLHRDLKPENILISDENIIKITDFGLAKFIKSGSIAASTAGTPIYMAPEVWSGKFSEKSDVWSIGVILYELVTGTPPFLDDNLDGLKQKITKSKFLKPGILRPDIPEYFENVILKCLNVISEARPDTAELLNGLKRKSKSIKIETSITIAREKEEELTLSPDQEKIVSSLNGKLLVLGQAGCGKTTSLVYGILKLIKDGVSPSKILVCTFTNKSANDIKNRIGKIMTTPQYDLWIGTLHTIAMRILRRDGERLDIGENFIIEEPKKIFAKIDIEKGKFKANAILRVIEKFKAGGIPPEKITPQNKWEETCSEAYKKYQSYLKAHNILDYDDLIIFATELLEEHSDLADFYKNNFEYIFVDELQDINPVQYRFIKLLIKDKFFFTGDEDQAIYGWRGANRDIIYQVPQEYQDVQIFHLNRSFRLPQAILEIGNNLMLRHTTAIPNLDTGDVVFYAADSPEDEVDYVIREIKDITEQIFSWGDIAILFRMNYLAQGYAQGLAKAEIPYTLISGVSFFERTAIKPIIEYLEILGNYEKTRIPENIVAKTIASLNVNKKIQKKLERIIQYQIQNLNTLTPYIIINEIVSCLGLQNEYLEEFLAFAKEHQTPDINKFLSELKLFQEMDLANWTKNTVKLMTIHSAKGMEFPVVFLVDLIEEIFPMAKSLSDQRELEEERRLCYVAVTRAQKRLYLLYPKFIYKKQQLPSRFLIDMLKKQKPF